MLKCNGFNPHYPGISGVQNDLLLMHVTLYEQQLTIAHLEFAHYHYLFFGKNLYCYYPARTTPVLYIVIAFRKTFSSCEPQKCRHHLSSMCSAASRKR